MKKTLSIISGAILTAGLMLAQAPPNGQTPQAAPAPSPLNAQVLGEMLHAAATFHELISNMNLSQALGPNQTVVDADGHVHHSMERTAQTIGAGAGAGAALGALTRTPNGMLIGALIGGAGGLIVDQILKEHEEQRIKEDQRAKASIVAAPQAQQYPSQVAPQNRAREFKTREPIPDSTTY